MNKITRTAHVQILVNLGFLFVFTAIALSYISLPLFVAGLAVAAMLSANLVFHKRAARLSKELIGEYLIVALMLLLLLLGALNR